MTYDELMAKRNLKPPNARRNLKPPKGRHGTAKNIDVDSWGKLQKGHVITFAALECAYFPRDLVVKTINDINAAIPGELSWRAFADLGMNALVIIGSRQNGV